MTHQFLRLAMWLFDVSMDELAGTPTRQVLTKEKSVTLSHLALVDSVLWATFGRQDKQAKFDC